MLNLLPKIINLPAAQTNRLQLVLNSAARAVTKTPKFHHITPLLKSLHWLNINERIQYRSDMVELRSFSDSTSSRIKNKLKTVCLSSREIDYFR